MSNPEHFASETPAWVLEGWDNRETWAANSLLVNNERMSALADEIAGESVCWARDAGPYCDYFDFAAAAKGRCADVLETVFREASEDPTYFDPDPAVIEWSNRIIPEVGSLDRVAWFDIAEPYVDKEIAVRSG